MHCVAVGGDGVTAVHVDGGLRAVLLGAVLAGATTPVGKSAHAVKLSCYDDDDDDADEFTQNLGSACNIERAQREIFTLTTTNTRPAGNLACPGARYYMMKTAVSYRRRHSRARSSASSTQRRGSSCPALLSSLPRSLHAAQTQLALQTRLYSRKTLDFMKTKTDSCFVSFNSLN